MEIDKIIVITERDREKNKMGKKNKKEKDVVENPSFILLDFKKKKQIKVDCEGNVMEQTFTYG